MADEPGVLGSGAYPDLDGSSSGGVGAAGRYRLSTRSDLSLGSRGGSAPPQHHPSGAKSSLCVPVCVCVCVHLCVWVCVPVCVCTCVCERESECVCV